MRESDTRVLNPAAYTTPASAFNTLAVDFANGTMGSPKRKFKTKAFEGPGGSLMNLMETSSASCSTHPPNHTHSLNRNCSTLSSLGTMSTSSSSDIFNLSSTMSTPGGSKPASNYGTLDKVTTKDTFLNFLQHSARISSFVYSNTWVQYAFWGVIITLLIIA